MGWWARAKAAALANACPGGCFAPGTMVLLADGTSKPIEDGDVGDEVVCVPVDLPFAVPDDFLSTEPDHYRSPSSNDWIQVSFEATAADQHGLSLTLARPKAWVHREKVTVGSRIPLTLTEMGVEWEFLVTGMATLDYKASSTASHGMAGQELIPGRLIASFPVTGTFRREVDSTLSISTGGSDFIVTSDHLLHSASRGSWVRVGDLEVGESLTGLSGPSTIQRLLAVAGPLVVFNLEVHRGHSFVLADTGSLVHNNCGAVARALDIVPNKSHEAKGGMDFEEAVDHVKNGGNVLAKDKSTAKKIAEAAGDGPPHHDGPHGPGQLPHCHPTSGGQRTGGHVAY